MSTVEHVEHVEQRESACPVHFLWDGRRHGRWFVRAGFLGFLVAGALVTAAVTVHSASLREGAAYVGVASGVVWMLGQLLSRIR